MRYVVVKLPEHSNRAELREEDTERVVAAGTLQAMVATGRLFGGCLPRIEGYRSCIEPRDE